MTPTMKVIIFDMDGVIFDTVATSQQYLMQQFPSATAEMQKELLTGNFHEELQKFKATNAPKAETEEEIEARKAAYSLKKLGAKMYDGMHDLLHELHEKGYILVLNTSALPRNTVPLLEKADIARIFDFVAASDVSKSKVDKFKIIEEKYDVSKDQLLFVTDTLGDIREADTAGIPTVAVTWGAHDHSFFGREPHANLKGIVDSVEELREFIYENVAI